MWTILIDGEEHMLTSHPESVINDLEFEFDIVDETWNSDSMTIELTTGEA